MDFREVIERRRTTSQFKDIPVEKEKIEAMLRAAMQAPSACNQQPWEFFVITNKEKLEALLFITVDKENIDIYKKRFEINRELMIKYGKEYSKIIQEQLAKGSIDVRSKTEKYKNSEGDGER